MPTSPPLNGHDPFEHRKLSIDNAARRSTDRHIVRKQDELDVQHRTLPHPAHRHARAVLEVPVEARLGPVWLLVHDDRVARRGRTAERARVGGERGEGLADLLGRGRGPLGEAHGDARCVPVDDGDAVARCADAEGVFGVHVEGLYAGIGAGGGAVVVVLVFRVGDAAEDFERFPFYFFFLALDVGDDVVEDVEGGNAGVACAGDGLEGGDDDGFDGAEGSFEGGEGDDAGCG